MWLELMTNTDWIQIFFLLNYHNPVDVLLSPLLYCLSLKVFWTHNSLNKGETVICWIHFLKSDI